MIPGGEACDASHPNAAMLELGDTALASEVGEICFVLFALECQINKKRHSGGKETRGARILLHASVVEG